MEFLILCIIAYGIIYTTRKFLMRHVKISIAVNCLLLPILLLILGSLVGSFFAEVKSLVEDLDDSRHLNSCEWSYSERNFESLKMTLELYGLDDEEMYGKYWEIIEAYHAYQSYQIWKNARSNGMEGADIKEDKYATTLRKYAERAEYADNQKIIRKWIETE